MGPGSHTRISSTWVEESILCTRMGEPVIETGSPQVTLVWIGIETLRVP